MNLSISEPCVIEGSINFPVAVSSYRNSKEATSLAELSVLNLFKYSVYVNFYLTVISSRVL